MTAYIAEANRLTDAGFPPAESIPFIAEYRRELTTTDAEGLCIEGCPSCRSFRNSVREAQAAERQAIAEADQRFEDFEREESHAVTAAVDFADHLDLLPETRLSTLAKEALDNAIGLAHLAFDEARSNGFVLNQPQDELSAALADLFGGMQPLAFEVDPEDMLDATDPFGRPY